MAKKIFLHNSESWWPDEFFLKEKLDDDVLTESHKLTEIILSRQKTLTTLDLLREKIKIWTIERWKDIRIEKEISDTFALLKWNEDANYEMWFYKIKKWLLHEWIALIRESINSTEKLKSDFYLYISQEFLPWILWGYLIKDNDEILPFILEFETEINKVISDEYEFKSDDEKNILDNFKKSINDFRFK